MRELTVDSAGVRLAVRDHGGDGHPLVCVHGLSSNLEIWEPVAAILREAFRVVAYDQRGHGRSDDGDDYSYEAVAGDLAAVVSALGLDAPVVAGHSWGASVALHHAARHDVRAVVCVDGGVIDMQGFGQSWEDTAQLLRPPDLEGPPDELMARIRAEQSLVPWDVLEPVVRRSFPVGPDGVMRRRLPVDEHMRIVHAMWAERIGDVHARVTAPVLVVLASGVGADHREDGFVALKREAVRRLRERMPGLAVEWLPSVHDVPLLHPRELADLIAGAAGSG